MKRIINIFIISLISLSFFSFTMSHSADGAIEKVKKAVKNYTIGESEFITKHMKDKAEFFKSVCELNDEEFIIVYSQMRPWRNEVRDNCESKLEKIEAEIEELEEKTDVAYSKAQERYNKIMEARKQANKI